MLSAGQAALDLALDLCECPEVPSNDLLLIYASFAVSGGSFSATVPARSAIAIHTNATGSGLLDSI